MDPYWSTSNSIYMLTNTRSFWHVKSLHLSCYMGHVHTNVDEKGLYMEEYQIKCF